MRTNNPIRSVSPIRTQLGSVLLFGLLTACGASSDPAGFRMAVGPAPEPVGWSSGDWNDSDDWTSTGTYDLGGYGSTAGGGYGSTAGNDGYGSTGGDGYGSTGDDYGDDGAGTGDPIDLGTCGGGVCPVCEDPDGIVPPEGEAKCNYNYTETCKIISGIKVCENKYVPGSYVCADFANDFCTACEAQGIPTWKLWFGCGYYRNYHKCLGYTQPFYHAINIVEIDYPGPLRKFCIVEPQNNKEVTCWIDDKAPTTPLPANVVTAMHTFYDSWGWQTCTDEGWGSVYDIYD